MVLTYRLRKAVFGPVWSFGLGVLLLEEVKVMDLETVSGQVCHADQEIHVELP